MSPSTSTPQDAFKRPRTPKPADIQVGDTVRIGKGKVLWTVRDFWSRAGVDYANLWGGGGYSTASATLDRLTVVSKNR